MEGEPQPVWLLENSRSMASTQDFVFVEASHKDFETVLSAYQRYPVPGYEVCSVQGIYNSDLEKAFEIHVRRLSYRHGQTAFEPGWHKEGTADEQRFRKSTHLRLEKQSQLNNSNVRLISLWHGTSEEVISSICRMGYVNLARTDSGFFGKGLYSTWEAEYAHRVYSKGALFLNWVVFFSAYPVIGGDMDKLTGKGNYQNYDAHYIPVVPVNPDNPHEKVYSPCVYSDQEPQYTELVVFDSAAILPRFLVKLQATLLKAPSLLPPTKSVVLSENLLIHIQDYVHWFNHYRKLLIEKIFSISEDIESYSVWIRQLQGITTLEKLAFLDALENLKYHQALSATRLKTLRDKLWLTERLKELGKCFKDSTFYLQYKKEKAERNPEKKTKKEVKISWRVHAKTWLLSYQTYLQLQLKEPLDSSNKTMIEFQIKNSGELYQRFEAKRKPEKRTSKIYQRGGEEKKKPWSGFYIDAQNSLPNFNELRQENEYLEKSHSCIEKRYLAFRREWSNNYNHNHPKQFFLYKTCLPSPICKGKGSSGLVLSGYFHLSNTMAQKDQKRWVIDWPGEKVPGHALAMGTNYFSISKTENKKEESFCLEADYQMSNIGSTSIGYGRSLLPEENRLTYQTAYDTCRLLVRQAKLYETADEFYESIPCVWQHTRKALKKRCPRPEFVPSSGAALTYTFQQDNRLSRMVAAGTGNVMVFVWEPTSRTLHTLIKPRQYQCGEQFVPIPLTDPLAVDSLQREIINLPAGSLVCRLTPGVWKILPHNQSSPLYDPVIKKMYLEYVLDESLFINQLSKLVKDQPNPTEDDYLQALRQCIEKSLEAQKSQLWEQQQKVWENYEMVLDVENKKMGEFLHQVPPEIYQKTIGLLRGLNICTENLEEQPLEALGELLKTKVQIGGDMVVHCEVIPQPINMSSSTNSSSEKT